MVGFEPTLSASQKQRLNQTSLHSVNCGAKSQPRTGDNGLQSHRYTNLTNLARSIYKNHIIHTVFLFVNNFITVFYK